MPPGIDYKSVDISVLAGVSSRADVPREPRVDPDDGVPLTPEGNVVDPWNISVVTHKVMAFKGWDVNKMVEVLGGLVDTNELSLKTLFTSFLQMQDFPTTGVAYAKEKLIMNPSMAFQNCAFYLPLVQKLIDIISNEMEGDEKLDALSSEY